MSARIVIVGAGPAGTRAAEALVEAGLRPVVIDEGLRSGGQIYRRQPAGFRRSYEQLYGTEAARARAVHETFDRLLGSIDYRPETLVWGMADGRVHTSQAGRAEAIDYDALIIASGATDRLLPVPGWNNAGVYSLGAMQIALKAQACALGRSALFLGTGPLLYLVAAQYAKAGAHVSAVLDTARLSDTVAALPDMMVRPSLLAKGAALLRTLAARRIPVRRGFVPVAIHMAGSGDVAEVEIEVQGRRERFACDAVGLGFHLRPETQLADLAGCDFRFDEGTRLWLPQRDDHGRSSVAGVYLAGDGAHIAGADAAEVSGRLAALALLQDRGQAVAAAEVAKLRRARRRLERFARGIARAYPWPRALAETCPPATILCRCEGITVGDVRETCRETGAREINRVKAFSRIGMGRCQGRYCSSAAAELLAGTTGDGQLVIGRLRGQAPVKPVPMALGSATDA